MRMMHVLMLQLVAVTTLQALRVTLKPLVMMVIAPEKMAHPVAPVGVAGIEAEAGREGEDRVVGEEPE